MGQSLAEIADTGYGVSALPVRAAGDRAGKNPRTEPPTPRYHTLKPLITARESVAKPFGSLLQVLILLAFDVERLQQYSTSRIFRTRTW
jgi:hypothetical protein